MVYLSKLVHLFQDNSHGLYQDDGLGVLRDFSGPETERFKKNVKIFKNRGLSITSKTNLIIDIWFTKPDNLQVYIRKHSNHPPTVLNELTKGIAKKISDLPSSKNIFHNAIPVYKEALRKSGFTSDLVYTHKHTDYNNNNDENKKPRHKIIWLNPPFSRSVKSNIGKIFQRYFPKTNKLHKTFNKSTTKVSYSSKSNMSSIPSSHNLDVINPYET